MSTALSSLPSATTSAPRLAEPMILSRWIVRRGGDSFPATKGDRLGRFLLFQMEDPHGIGAADSVPLLGRNVTHHGIDRHPRVRPIVAVMGVVRRPHDVVDARAIAVLDAVAVHDEGGRHVAVPVVAGRLPERDFPQERLRQ
jgi:hypothetical protein